MKSNPLILVCAMLALTGCVSSGNKIDMAQVSAIQKGATTRTDCERIFGPPNSSSMLPDGTFMDVWMHIEAKSHAANFIPIYGAFATKVDTNSDTLQIYFDSAGRVTDLTSNSSNSTMKAGLIR